MSTEITKATPRHFYGNKGTSTPWGCADTAYRLARGVVWYGTPGHGGLSVTLKWARDNLTLQAQYLGMFYGGKLWFEEDCKCSLVFHEHPELWTRLTGQSAPSYPFEESIRRWDPDYFDPEFIATCRKAGDVPDLLFLQPGDVIKLTGNPNTYRVAHAWLPRGKQLDRVITREDGARPDYRLTDTDARGRLECIIREGETVWTRPRERPFEAKRQAANG